MYPKLRPIQPIPTMHAGQEGFVLRDPLALSERMLFLPRKLAPILTLCDGTRDLAGLRAALMVQFGVRASLQVLTQLVAQLDEAYLLDSERFTQAHDAALQAYREAPFRPPQLAGHGYPSEPEQLAAFFASFEAQLIPDDRASESDADVRGVICPHIDYQRGGRVYASLWQRAAQAARQAELIVVLGTDHNGGGLLTPTYQHYATPWGILPTSQAVVDALTNALGEEKALHDELNHQIEHSLELAIVWLHSVLDGHTTEMVPILTGSFQQFIDSQTPPDDHEELRAVVKVLREVAAQKRTLVIAAADLAHMGPAFGGPPLDFDSRAKLRGADDQLLVAICEGDAEAFFQQIKLEGDRRNICGLPPIYLALQILGPAHGQITGYEICPADQTNTSSVSVASVLLW
jgi:AmmeMemoRadiSam system protein B